MRELSDDVTERNYAKEPLTRKELEEIVKAVGSTESLVNTRHAVSKDRGWKTKAPSKAAFIKAALEDANVMRRPVLVRGSKAVVGKDEEALAQLMK